MKDLQDIKSWLNENAQLGQFNSTPPPPSGQQQSNNFNPSVNSNASDGNSPMQSQNNTSPELEQILSQLDQIDSRLGNAKVFLRRFVTTAMELPKDSRSLQVGNQLRQVLMQVANHLSSGNDNLQNMKVARNPGQSGLQNSGEQPPLRP